MSKILILEDDVDILDIMGIILEESHSVRLLSDSKNWQRVVMEYCPEIILLDIRLGNADGIEISKNIKLNPETSHIRVILTSAAIYDPEQLKAYSDGYLEKPFDIAVLQKIVNNI